MIDPNPYTWKFALWMVCVVCMIPPMFVVAAVQDFGPGASR